MKLLKGNRYKIDWSSKYFPDCLLKICNPPKNLFIIGNPLALKEGLGVVGARNASPYGLSNVAHFGKIAAKYGVCLISGGAYGCDSAAHRAAIENDGQTVVFLAGGCDNPYPKKNVSLFQNIIDNGGAIVSENDWTAECFKSAFLKRNRLIAGLSKALLVAEAGLPSGTFTTANFAIDAGKEIWTIPGAITFPGAMGCNSLIYEGATPIINDDIFKLHLNQMFGVDVEYKKKILKMPRGYKLGSTGNPILEALMAQPMKPDQLFEYAKTKCGGQEPHSWLASMLIEAENSGFIAKYKDGTYGPVIKNE